MPLSAGQPHLPRVVPMPEEEGAYFLLAGIRAAGLPGTAVNGEVVAVTFGLFCLGFFGSRPLRF